MYEKIINDKAQKHVDKIVTSTRSYIEGQLRELGLPTNHTSTIIDFMARKDGVNLSSITQALASTIIDELISDLGNDKEINKDLEIKKDHEKETKNTKENKDTKNKDGVEIKTGDPLADFLAGETEDVRNLLPDLDVMRQALKDSGYRSAFDVKENTVVVKYKELMGIAE